MRRTLEGHELVEVRRVGAADDADAGSGPERREQGRTLLVGQAVVDPRQHGTGRNTAQCFEILGRRVEQRGVAAKLVEYESLHALLVPG